MTKKDYIKLAQALKDCRPLEDTGQIDGVEAFFQWKMTVEHITETLRLDNPQFSRDRFLHACGYTQKG